MTWMIQFLAGRMNYFASCLMGLLFTALTMGLFSGKSASGQMVVYEAPIHNFPTGSGDGTHPLAGLLIDAQGNLYGTTATGSVGAGTVFEMVNNSGIYSEQTLYSFHPTSVQKGIGVT